MRNDERVQAFQAHAAKVCEFMAGLFPQVMLDPAVQGWKDQVTLLQEQLAGFRTRHHSRSRVRWFQQFLAGNKMASPRVDDKRSGVTLPVNTGFFCGDVPSPQISTNDSLDGSTRLLSSSRMLAIHEPIC